MFKRINIFLLTGFFLFSGMVGAYAESLEKVTITEGGRGFFHAPLYVAHGKGLFEKEGLKVEIVTVRGGNLAMGALVAGQAQFCITSQGLAANLFLKGKKTKIVNQMQHRCTLTLIGRPEFQQIKDLKGKFVSCYIGSESDAVLRFLLTKAGLDPEKDVKIVQVGDGSAMAAALENNKVQAIVGWEPLTSKLISEKKAVCLARLNTEEDSIKHLGSPSYAFSAILVTDKYLRRNPNTIQKFVNAMVAAERWMASHSIEEWVDVVSPYFPGSDKNMLKIPLENDKNAFSRDGIVTREGHHTAIKAWMDAGLIKQPVAFEDIVDNSFSQEAQTAIKKTIEQ